MDRCVVRTERMCYTNIHINIQLIILFRDMVPCMHVHSWPLSTEMWEGEVLAVNYIR